MKMYQETGPDGLACAGSEKNGRCQLRFETSLLKKKKPERNDSTRKQSPSLYRLL